MGKAKFLLFCSMFLISASAFAAESGKAAISKDQAIVLAEKFIQKEGYAGELRTRASGATSLGDAWLVMFPFVAAEKQNTYRMVSMNRYGEHVALERQIVQPKSH